MSEPDPKHGPRIRDPELMQQAHWAFDECVICGAIDISIHHVLARSLCGDDVWENLVPLCGDGVTGCHGSVENEEDHACHALGRHLLRERPDTVAYLAQKLAGPEATAEEAAEAAAEWLHRRYGVRL